MRHEQPPQAAPPPERYTPQSYTPPALPPVTQPHAPPASGHGTLQPLKPAPQPYTPTPIARPYTPTPQPFKPTPQPYTSQPQTPPPRQYTPPPPHPYAPPPPGYMRPHMRRGMSSASKAAIAIVCFVAVLIVFGVIGSMAARGPETITTGNNNNIGYASMPIATAAPTDTEVLSGAQIFANNRDAVIIIRGICLDGYHWTGSGFFVTSTGVAVTNHHVMDGITYGVAILYDGREFYITGYYSYDIRNDLAVIHVDGRGTRFDYVTLGNSDATMVGENVFAIGGPDWDPITFTPGMISRIAYEPINFSIYSIAGMFQSTAAIYGGNSGGPLLNDRGHVIGVNAAAHTVRASVQFAVPINRVAMPNVGATVNPLPICRTTAPQFDPSESVMYTRFPFIPDFMSVSRHGTFYFSGTPADLGLSVGDVLYDFYDYLFIYEMPRQHWITDTDAFDDALFASGFTFQDVMNFGNETWVYFYHGYQDVSLSYGFLADSDLLIIGVVYGNVYERLYGGEPAPIHNDVDFTGHPLVNGTWAWDTDSGYTYDFWPDGTGIRGFYWNIQEFYWYAYGNYLLIDIGRHSIEEWTFTIHDGVLTIVSNQVDGLTWSYIWQAD